jgi:L-2-hydroxyglutarate oxidase
MEAIVPGRAGICAMATALGGTMSEDFQIEYKANAIHVLNVPSPAAAFFLAIGEQVSEMTKQHFALKTSRD